MNLICGIHPVLEALGAGTRHFDRLLIAKGIRNARISEAIARASQLGIPLRFEARETLDRMAGEVPHQGIIAVVSAKPVMALEDLLRDLREPPLLLVLDGVEDPRNLGAIVRTAEAAGVDGVLLPERHSAGLSETVARASAGALEHVRVARIGNVVQALEALKERGFWVVGFDAAGGERWDAVDYKRPIAVVLGGEGRGIRRLVREACDHLVALPLFGHVASLNVSVAAGIALYEVIRQRGAVPSHVRPIPVGASAAIRKVLGPGPHDVEHDPGRDHVPPHSADHLVQDGRPPRVLDIPEDAAWTGPLVVKAVRGRRGAGRPWPRGRGHKPKRGGPQPTGPTAPRPPRHVESPSTPGPGAPGPGPPSSPRRQGRHRRRRRGQGLPVPASGGAVGGSPPVPEPVPGGMPPPSPAPPEAAGTGPSRRRRRRRRRR